MSDTPVLFGPEVASKGQIPKWFLLITIPVDILVIGLIVLALLPVEFDPPSPQDQWGAGAVNIEPAWSGLLRV